MFRLAELLQRRRVADLVSAGFLNFSRPSFAEAVQRCREQGATRILVQPYLLIDGFFVRTLVPRLVAEAAAAHPMIAFRTVAPLGYHPALVELVLERALAAASQPLDEATGLLLMAHGTPHPEANAPIERIAAELGRHVAEVAAGFMELNEPSIPRAVDALTSTGAKSIVALPYFLHLGEHVAADLPEVIRRAAAKHPQVHFQLAEHLAYHSLLAEVIEDRLAGDASGVGSASI